MCFEALCRMTQQLDQSLSCFERANFGTIIPDGKALADKKFLIRNRNASSGMLRLLRRRASKRIRRHETGRCSTLNNGYPKYGEPQHMQQVRGHACIPLPQRQALSEYLSTSRFAQELEELTATLPGEHFPRDLRVAGNSALASLHARFRVGRRLQGLGLTFEQMFVAQQQNLNNLVDLKPLQQVSH